MKQSDSIANLAAALVKASAAIKPIPKDRTNPHFRNRYATLDAIVEATRPVLAAHGLAVIQGSAVPETHEGTLVGFNVETMLVHSSGEWLSNAVLMPVEKASAQGAGSALTYGRRYGLSALLNLTADEDDDGETATNHAPRPAAASAPRPAAAPARPAASNAPSGKGKGVMPFGKTKGKALADLTAEQIQSALDWVTQTCPDKFTDFQMEARTILFDEANAVVAAGIDAGETDDLPF